MQGWKKRRPCLRDMPPGTAGGKEALYMQEGKIYNAAVYARLSKEDESVVQQIKSYLINHFKDLRITAIEDLLPFY